MRTGPGPIPQPTPLHNLHSLGLNQGGLPNPINRRDNSVRRPHLEEGVIGWVHRDRMCFASLTQIKVGALRVHTLVTNTVDTPAASIASCEMQNRNGTLTTNVIRGFCDLDECMMGMLLRCNTEARRARVKVRTVQTFIAVAFNPRVTKVTRRIMDHGLFLRTDVGSGSTSSINRCSLPLSFPCEHGVNDDSSRFLKVKELVERIVTLCISRTDA